MAVYLDDSVLDAALDKIATGDKVILCSALPSSYANATTGVDLATVTVDSGDFTKANGTTGRKVTIGQQTGVTVDHSGTATHVAIVDDGASVLLAATTITSQVVTAANTVTINAFDITIADAVAA